MCQPLHSRYVAVASGWWLAAVPAVCSRILLQPMPAQFTVCAHSCCHINSTHAGNRTFYSTIQRTTRNVALRTVADLCCFRPARGTEHLGSCGLSRATFSGITFRVQPASFKAALLSPGDSLQKACICLMTDSLACLSSLTRLGLGSGSAGTGMQASAPPWPQLSLLLQFQPSPVRDP